MTYEDINILSENRIISDIDSVIVTQYTADSLYYSWDYEHAIDNVIHEISRSWSDKRKWAIKRRSQLRNKVLPMLLKHRGKGFHIWLDDCPLY